MSKLFLMKISICLRDQEHFPTDSSRLSLNYKSETGGTFNSVPLILPPPFQRKKQVDWWLKSYIMQIPQKKIQLLKYQK